MKVSDPVIGILDSGVGGLSVLLEIHAKLANFPIHYIGDSAWCPYGNKPAELIQSRASAVTEKLIEMGADIVVVACNSATIHAIEALRNLYPIPFVGMEPAIKPASKVSQSGIIGVLATEASIAGEKFHSLLKNHIHPHGLRVITHHCPKFVALVEAGILHGRDVEAAVDEYATPMIAAGADTLVLGCTHYPFLKPTIQSVVGPNIEIIDTGKAIAQQVARLVGNSACSPEIYVNTTGNIECLEKIFPMLCPSVKAKLGKVSIV